MPILHGISVSPFVRKVKVVIGEKSIACESKLITPFTVDDAYRRKSPLGKIPCWEDGDFTLPDSSCIIAYLDRIHPEPPMLPADPKQLGRALWFEEYADSRLVESVLPAFFERVVKTKLLKQDPDEERVGKALAELVPPTFDYLEGEVGDREFLVGDAFSVADVAVASPFVNFGYAGEKIDASRWPKLAAYVERLHARASFQAALAEDAAVLGGAS